MTASGLDVTGGAGRNHCGAVIQSYQHRQYTRPPAVSCHHLHSRHLVPEGAVEACFSQLQMSTSSCEVTISSSLGPGAGTRMWFLSQPASSRTAASVMTFAITFKDSLLCSGTCSGVRAAS
jgi:hypothetical protein